MTATAVNYAEHKACVHLLPHFEKQMIEKNRIKRSAHALKIDALKTALWDRNASKNFGSESLFDMDGKG